MVIEKSKKWQPVSSVELSVEGKTGESSDKKLAFTDETGESSDKTSGSSDYGIRNHYIIIFPVFLSLCLYCTRVRSWIRNLRCCLTINI
ncbi:hypothetical protein PGIGA_G00251530 [Pangasianodon gigas]|uniref:Uncharacterized protein n=1 Tax=Pangasianodon gigas TaxID=30993 RepID=A0ACC5WRN3_PANGG|nr:hypothetical protein [Pangasianodon gigas]